MLSFWSQIWLRPSSLFCFCFCCWFFLLILLHLCFFSEETKSYVPINVRPAEGRQGMGWGFDCLCRPWGGAFDWSCSPMGGDIWIFPLPTWGYLTADLDERDSDQHMFPASTLHACALSLVLICLRSTCDIAVGSVCDTSPTYEDIMSPATRNIAVFTAACLRSQTRVNFAGMPVVKTDMASVASDFCSHIGTVSQAAPAAMSQVAPWHMRTRLYGLERSWNHGGQWRPMTKRKVSGFRCVVFKFRLF